MEIPSPDTYRDSRARIEILGLKLPEVVAGDDLGRLLVEAARESWGGIEEGDLVVVTSKVISKSSGLLVDSNQVVASPRAERIARAVGGNPKKIQIVLDHSDRVFLAIPVRELAEKRLVDLDHFSEETAAADAAIERNPSMLLVERGGQIYFDAGVDFSNHPTGIASVPPIDPNKTARELREAIRQLSGVQNVAVVVSDTELSPAGGSVDVARGAAGMRVIDHGMGRLDRFGHPKFGGMDNRAQEMAAAAALLMGQAAEGIPAVLIRGTGFHPCEKDRVGGWTAGPGDARSLICTVLKRTIRALGLGSLLAVLFRR